jgi:hypothetical protein
MHGNDDPVSPAFLSACKLRSRDDSCAVVLHCRQSNKMRTSLLPAALGTMGSERQLRLRKTNERFWTPKVRASGQREEGSEESASSERLLLKWRRKPACCAAARQLRAQRRRSRASQEGFILVDVESSFWRSWHNREVAFFRSSLFPSRAPRIRPVGAHKFAAPKKFVPAQ